MRSVQHASLYLRLRGDTWHYVRRVPKSVLHVEGRTMVYRSLKTDSRKVARQRRDIFAAADDQKWSEIAPSRFDAPSRDAVLQDLRVRAESFGVTHAPAQQLEPEGLPHFKDVGYLLSQSLLKAFKSRGLLPSKNHRIYSFRHSFEKRMLEGGLDYGLRCTLMGHRNPRPE